MTKNEFMDELKSKIAKYQEISEVSSQEEKIFVRTFNFKDGSYLHIKTDNKQVFDIIINALSGI